MLYFLDTEFHEDGKTIDLISIGVVAEDGREFYAISQEAELHRVNPWVRANVLPRLPPYGDSAWMTRKAIADQLILFTGGVVTAGGVAYSAQDVILPEQAGPYPPLNDKPKFWGYFCDYDWVVLCQLFGTMMDLPKGWPMWCRDLKQLSVDVGDPQHPPQTGEHHALADARWNRDLYAFLMSRR